MINYFNFKIFNDKYLIINDLGYSSFVTKEELSQLIYDNIDITNSKGKELVRKFFVVGGSKQDFLSRTTYLLRENKSYLLHSTSLHIFVLTTACNLQCVYCQARSGEETSYGMMDCKTAEKAVDFALQSPDQFITFEFQGGEPLLNFPTIKHIIEYTEAHRGKKQVDYTLVSNLLLLNDEILDYILQHKISLSTSLDGNEAVHNINRPFINGAPSYGIVVEKIRYLQNKGINLGAIETTTAYSLQYPEQIVDTYEKLGFKSVFIRPLTPLGYAARNWKTIGYKPQEFVEFYRKCLERVIQINKQGKQFAESHAAILLKKIMCNDSGNYMELRSPCGGVIGQIAYFYNGDIYTCDEGRMLGEMGDPIFRLGNVYNDRFDDVICSKSCKAMMASSLLEALPECCDCVYQPYCGTCPVLNYKQGGDIYSNVPNDYKCRIYKGIMDILFEYISQNQEDIINIFHSWIS
ncbi:His-Xaa-Ser system radical SAM maturase HxsB [Lachnoclostridium sp. Marseille-P6806]|uniref:His-Xaa-Ser system radical SAM maturase HxsB n=1 Tax=Lachnoclostridium sp. Marseille-P6806 TaxID=2364793 RepID=UPI001F5F38CD|nr:His-Xaa-Ser system radical SAM maturase HxsB [Lachnoclostridium sp. Marseille-P6806]